jgi:hypothetical protein
MAKFARVVVAPLAFAGLLVVSGAAAQAATCIKKAGTGTGSTDDSASFQAWEAVLQATDWGSWASFMTTGMKVGTAPGYKVSNVIKRCRAGGMLGRECTMQATLCK